MGRNKSPEACTSLRKRSNKAKMDCNQRNFVSYRKESSLKNGRMARRSLFMTLKIETTLD